MGFDKNSKLIKFLIVLVILLVIFAGYLVITNSARFKLKMAIQSTFNIMDDSLKELENSSMENVLLDNKVESTSRIVTKVSLSNDVLKFIGPAGKKLENFINNSTIETNIKSDIPNKYMDIGLDYTYNNEKMYVNTYMKNNSMYLYLKDYFDKYLKIETEELDSKGIFNQMDSTVKVEDIRYMLSVLKFSIVDASEFANVNSSKVEIDVDGKRINVNETKLNVDTNFINKLKTIFLNKVLHDDKAKVIIFNMIQTGQYQTIDELEAAIQEEILKIERTTEENQMLGEYSIYTLGIFNKLVRNEIKILGETEVVVQYTKYNAEKFDDQISLYENNELFGQINIMQNSKDNYDIAIKVGQDISMDLKGTISKSLLDIAYTLRISGYDDFKGDLRVEEKKASETELNQTLIFRLNTPESYGTVNLTADSTMKIVNTEFAVIPILDGLNTRNIDSLTDNEALELMTNFQNKNPKTINDISVIINDILENFMTNGF